MSDNADLREDQATELLASMAEILAADGYQLDVRWPRDASLELEVTAGAEACADCLIPVDIFRSLAADALGEGGLPLPHEQISVTYPTS